MGAIIDTLLGANLDQSGMDFSTTKRFFYVPADMHGFIRFYESNNTWIRILAPGLVHAKICICHFCPIPSPAQFFERTTFQIEIWPVLSHQELNQMPLSVAGASGSIQFSLKSLESNWRPMPRQHCNYIQRLSKIRHFKCRRQVCWPKPRLLAVLLCVGHPVMYTPMGAFARGRGWGWILLIMLWTVFH